MDAEPLISPFMLAAMLAAGAATTLPARFAKHETVEPASGNEVSDAADLAVDSAATCEWRGRLQAQWSGAIRLIVHAPSGASLAVRRLWHLAQGVLKRAVHCVDQRERTSLQTSVVVGDVHHRQ